MADAWLERGPTFAEIQSRFVESVSNLNRSFFVVFFLIGFSVLALEYFAYHASENNIDLAETVNLAERQRSQVFQIAVLVGIETEDSIDNAIPSIELSEKVERIRVEGELLNNRLLEFSSHKSNPLATSLKTSSQLRDEILDSIETHFSKRGDPFQNHVERQIGLSNKTEQFSQKIGEIVGRTRQLFVESSQKLQRVTFVSFGIIFIGCLIILTQFVIYDVRTKSKELSRITTEKHRLAVIAERTSNAVIITDIDGRIEWVNAGFTRITDYTFEEAIGKKPGDLLQYEKTDPAIIDKIRRAIRSRTSINCQLQNRAKSGREYWLEINLQTLNDQTGNVVGFMAVETDISELKKIESKIREEQDVLLSTLDALTSKVAIIDQQGHVIKANKRWIEFQMSLMSYLPTDMDNPNLFRILDSSDLLTPSTCKEVISGFKQVLNGKIPCFEIEYPYCPQKNKRWLRSVATACTRDGKINAVVSTEDITDRVDSERKAQAYASRVQAVFDGSSDAILLLSEGNFLDCNKKALGIFGISSKDQLAYLWKFKALLYSFELSGMSSTTRSLNINAYSANPDWLDTVKSQESPESEPPAQTHEAQNICFEWNLERVDGTIFPAEILVSKLELDGEPVLLASVRDISDRKETLRYLDMYRSIVDRHAIVAETDMTGRILYANDQFCEISGYSRNELINQNHRILNSGTHSKQFWRNVFKLVANKQSWHGEICNKTKDGRLYWVATTIAPLLSHEGKIRGYFAIRTDITALKNAKVQAQAASDAKSQFLANMSHEIRTPMTAILGYADLLADEIASPNKPTHCIEYVNTIKRNGEHLLSIINDILDISKIEADKMEVESIVTNPEQIIKEVIALMKVKALDRRIDLRVHIHPSIPRAIQSDPTRIRQILMNLLGNAIKFTEQGEVVLEVNTSSSPNLQMEFVVRDTGIGMTPDQLERLFSAFYQADATMTRRFGGSGLGLQISKRLALMLGGDLTARSTYGKGSEFQFTLPLKEIVIPYDSASIRQSSANNDSGSVSPQDTPLFGVKILLAEDGIDNQKLITFHLRKAGADVTVVPNGKEAIQALTVDGTIEGALMSPNRFDLILTDMQMPEMDGYSAARLLRAKGCQLPILALTANAMASDAAMCIEAGCDEHVSKPIDRQQLVETCSRWAKRHSRGVIVDGLGGVSDALRSSI
ncbi:PAS domain S-box protein [Pirellulaceae bacterium SH449]